MAGDRKALTISLAIYVAAWFLWALWQHTGAMWLGGRLAAIIDVVFVKSLIWILPALFVMMRKNNSWLVEPKRLISTPFPWLECVVLLCVITAFLYTVRLARGLTTTYVLFDWIFIVFSLGAGVIEEFSFRGFFFNLHVGMIGFWPAAILNATIFTLYHYPGLLFGESFLQILSWRGLLLFSMGVLFCWMFKQWRNLALNMTIHSVWDILTYLFCLTG